MNKKVFISLFILSMAGIGYAQTKTQPNWQDFNTLVNATDQSIMSMIYVYQPNCELCILADNSIFSDTTVINALNKNFNSAKFDATCKEDIMYKGAKYTYSAFTETEGIHILSVSLLDGKMGFPTFVFMDKNGNKVGAHYPIKDKEEFLWLLNYYSSGDYQQIPYEEWKNKH